MFITAAPTVVPSTSPSMSPVTTIPSAVPTITGAVASVSISGTVTSSMSSDDIDAISSDIAEIYGVDASDVETTVDYVASGTLDVTIPTGVSEEEAINAIQESISDVLGVHPKDVVVTIDDNGDVMYSVSGVTYDEAAAIQNAAAQATFVDQVTADLNEGDSGVVVESSTSNNDIEVILSVTVDTSEATGTADPVEEVSTLTQEYGLTNSIVEGIFIFPLTLFTNAKTIIITKRNKFNIMIGDSNKRFCIP